MKLVIKIFIECFSMIRILPDLLSEEEGLGIHTSVILFTATFGLRYFYCHKAFRPFGERIALQCQKCLGVRTLTFQIVPGDNHAYTRSCQCGWQDRRNLDLQDTIWPKSSDGGIVGWANQVMYGSRGDVEAAWKAPRISYNL
jgi:hypothetical protein